MTQNIQDSDANPMSSTPAKWSGTQKYVIFILLLVHMFNVMDRQVINVLSPAIKDDFTLSDAEIGLLTGPAFVFLYLIFGFPIARLADKKNRVNIVAISIAFWSLMTAVCGFAQNFIQLIFARLGVGIGEAGCNPASHSLISDYFPREQRATALGIFSIGLTGGSLFGILLGGYLVGSLGWRWAFIILGIPGVIVGLIVKMTLREPIRGASDTPSIREDLAKPSVTGPSVIESLRVLGGIKSYIILVISAGITAFAGYAFAAWIFHFIGRTHELSIEEFTIPLAVAIGIGGGIGIFLGGIATDRFAKKDMSSYFLIPSIVHFVSVPFFLLAIWANAPILCFAMLFLVFGLHASVAGPYYGIVQNLAPVNLRAFAIAVFAFSTIGVGLGLGPPITGWISDSLAKTMGEADGLRWTLTGLAPLWAIAGIMTLFGRKFLVEDLNQAALSS